jgi:hypothetical protein
MIDQSPIGRTPRSNPVTYIKAFDLIRALFASTRDAEKRGYTAGHFSFNIPGGRCETCQGDGTVTVEMQFLADVELVCEECKGTRFKSGILDIRTTGSTCTKCCNSPSTRPSSFSAARSAWYPEAAGAGRRGPGLSAAGPIGHHAFRRRSAARETGRASGAGLLRGHLYIFDEPTTGLHFDDIAKLLAALGRLIENGASLLIIEHNLDVIQGGGLGDRPGTRRRRPRRLRGGHRHARPDRQGARLLHRPVPTITRKAPKPSTRANTIRPPTCSVKRWPPIPKTTPPISTWRSPTPCSNATPKASRNTKRFWSLSPVYTKPN